MTLGAAGAGERWTERVRAAVLTASCCVSSRCFSASSSRSLSCRVRSSSSRAAARFLARSDSLSACSRSWFSTLMRAVYSATVARSSSWVAASAWLAAMACALLWRPELEAEAAAERASSSASSARRMATSKSRWSCLASCLAAAASAAACSALSSACALPLLAPSNSCPTSSLTRCVCSLASRSSCLSPSRLFSAACASRFASRSSSRAFVASARSDSNCSRNRTMSAVRRLSLSAMRFASPLAPSARIRSRLKSALRASHSRRATSRSPSFCVAWARTLLASSRSRSALARSSRSARCAARVSSTARSASSTARFMLAWSDAACWEVRSVRACPSSACLTSS
mmetsp:Transcript_23270/g.55384  ORF Transcript_23270/g.55384 Transcript_23270/m.55384 type:complete len:344 (-) Transcript_23270:879-1910(-)